MFFVGPSGFCLENKGTKKYLALLPAILTESKFEENI